MAKKVSTPSIRELLVKFTKATTEVRSTSNGEYPVHSVFTRYNGVNFIDLVAAVYQTDKQGAIKLIRSSDIEQIPVKGGYILALERREKKEKSSNKGAISDILSA